jgi:hypothetical protein
MIVNINSNPEAPTKIKKLSSCFVVKSEAIDSMMLKFQIATLVMIALQITNTTKTKYRMTFRRFSMIDS